jgi:hypothetical protein
VVDADTLASRVPQEKGLRCLDQKGIQCGRPDTRTRVVVKMLPANRADLPRSGTEAEHGKLVVFPLGSKP